MDRGSRFLSFAFPVSSEAEVSSILQRLKKEHPKANHFCTGLRLHPDSSIERSSDDGEPSGSAGKPILGQLVKLKLTNVLIVVVRYFGGTKLGVPGLIDAYRQGAEGVLANGHIIKKEILQPIRVTMGYDAQPSFLNYCLTHDVVVIDQTFDDQATVIIGIPPTSGHEGWKQILHRFSKMDFNTEDEYHQYLGYLVNWESELMIK